MPSQVGESSYGLRSTSDKSGWCASAIGRSPLWAQTIFQYSPFSGWIAKPARVIMLSRRQVNSLSASGILIASIAVAVVHSLRKRVAVQSSA